jgi:hypothetical protein
VAEEQLPFADVRTTPEGLSLPELKWRELVFVGALREQGGVWQRDPSRPMPRFEDPEPFPPGRRFVLVSRAEGRVHLRRLG